MKSIGLRSSDLIKLQVRGLFRNLISEINQSRTYRLWLISSGL